MTAQNVMRTMVAVLVLVTAEAGFAVERGAAGGSGSDVPVLLPVAAGQAKPAKVRQVGFSLHNGTPGVLRLTAGAEQIELQPGETRHVKLPEGTAMTTVEATPRLAAGTKLTTVSQALHGVVLTVS